MRLIKDQRGIAHTGIILAVLILAIAGGAYYFVNKANKDKDNTSATSQAAAEECQRQMDDKILCRFFSSYTEQKNYTATMTTTEDGNTGSIIMKYDGDNFHTIMQSEGDTYETINHNGDLYMKNDGQWLKMPGSDSEEADVTDTTPGIEIDDADVPQYKAVGKEACGSLTCYRYDFVDEEDAASTYSIWFDDKDYLVRKMTFTSAGGSGELLYDYAKVTVSPPENFSDMPTGEGMSPEELQQLMEQYAN